MLIISRRPGETLFLTDGARRMRIVILGLRGTQIKLGLDVPPEVVVERDDYVDPAQLSAQIKKSSASMPERAVREELQRAEGEASAQHPPQVRSS